MTNADYSSGNSLAGSSIPDFSRLLEICINRLNDAIVITEAAPIDNPGPRIVWANKVFYERNGYTPEEIIGKSPRILQGPETDRATLDKIRLALENWQSVRSEILNYRKDGSVYWNEIEIVPIANDQGWYTHWVSVQRDITERKQAENALKQSKKQTEAILNSTTESIFHVDETGTILAINEIAAHRVHSFPQDMLGKCAYDFFPPELAVSRRQNLAEVFRTGKVVYSEDSRNDHHFSLNYYPTFDTQGKVASVVVYATDITARKKESNSLRENEEKLRGLFHLSPLGIALTDMNGRYIEFNEAFQRICGYSKEELNSLDYWALTPDKYKPDEALQLLSLQQTSRYGPYEKEYIRKDGRLVPILLNGSLITGSDGKKYIWSIVEDISERQLMLAEIRESEERFRQMFERNSAVMLLIEPQSGMIVDANPAAATFYGYPLIYLKGKEISSITLQTEEQISHEMQLAIMEERNYHVFDHRLENGTSRTVEVHSSTVTFKNRSLLFAIIHDITDRKIAEEQIRQLAFYDTLTKIPNRRLLIDRLDQSIASCKRTANFGALMFLDLDNFKPLNDTHGHKLGDLLLIEAARRIGTCIRETDTVARFGGDEFVVMLGMLVEDQIASELLAGGIAENILESLSAPYLLTLANQDKDAVIVEHRCTASIGVTIFNGNSGSHDDILKRADAAMYAAKQGGRNRIQFYENT